MKENRSVNREHLAAVSSTAEFGRALRRARASAELSIRTLAHRASDRANGGPPRYVELTKNIIEDMEKGHRLKGTGALADRDNRLELYLWCCYVPKDDLSAWLETRHRVLEVATTPSRSTPPTQFETPPTTPGSGDGFAARAWTLNPDPAVAREHLAAVTSPAGFGSALRQARESAGLSIRTLEQKADDLGNRGPLRLVELTKDLIGDMEKGWRLESDHERDNRLELYLWCCGVPRKNLLVWRRTRRRVLEELPPTPPTSMATPASSASAAMRRAEFAALMCRAGRRSGLSAGQIVARSGIPRQTVYRYLDERNTRFPRDVAMVETFLRTVRMPEPEVRATVALWHTLNSTRSDATLKTVAKPHTPVLVSPPAPVAETANGAVAVDPTAHRRRARYQFVPQKIRARWRKLSGTVLGTKEPTQQGSEMLPTPRAAGAALDPEVVQFCADLVNLKDGAEVSYREMAHRSSRSGIPLSKTALQNATNPERGLPTSRVVLAFITALGLETAEQQQWTDRHRKLSRRTQ